MVVVLDLQVRVQSTLDSHRMVCCQFLSLCIAREVSTLEEDETVTEEGVWQDNARESINLL